MLKMKTKVFLLIIFAGTLIINSCKTADPPAPVINPPEEIQPGSRDYEWTVDTITLKDNYGMTPMRMWAASTKDIWTTGSAYSVNHAIWRYDGLKWRPEIVKKYIDPMGIWGSSKNDIWFGNCYDGSLWHYNGSELSLFSKTQIDSCWPFKISWIDGSSEKDIYAVGFADKKSGGYKGIIMHYDGVKWNLVDIPVMQISFIQILYNKAFGNYIVYGIYFEKPETEVFLFDGKNLKKIFESKIEGSIGVVGNKVYFTYRSDIYKYEDTTYKKIISLDKNIYQNSAIGNSEKDFFTINRDGLGHYNGTDLVTLWKKTKSDQSASCLKCIDDEIFSVWQGNRTDTTYFVHGKLRKKGG